ncbi:MAG: dihydroorotase [Myxococcota bacterium]|nr:dihydroorotase [Myxococcota bacterium]
MRTITIDKPDDWHLHLRDGDAMAAVVGHTAQTFGRAIIMPNLKPPVVRVAQARAYRARILNALPAESTFEPLMTLYLTDTTTPDDVVEAAQTEFIKACKLYPAGATTNSDSGVTDLLGRDDVLAAMAEVGFPLLLHGEVTAHSVDIFDREAVYVRDTLPGILERHPNLRVVLEHITSADAAEWVADGPSRLAATITPHHLLLNRNDMLVGGIRPHLYCLPILKTERDRSALVRAAISGNPKFFLGTDSAPHPVGAKESECGCAGVFSAPSALALYAEVFDEAGALDRLEGFASHFGPDFYRLPRHSDRVVLDNEPVAVPPLFEFGDEHVRPFRAGGHVQWRVRPLTAT